MFRLSGSHYRFIRPPLQFQPPSRLSPVTMIMRTLLSIIYGLFKLFWLTHVPAETATRGALCGKVFLQIWQNHRKTSVPASLFNKIAGLRPAALLKKIIWHRCFAVNFIKFLRTPFIWKFFEISKTFYTEYLWATASSQIVSQVSGDY